MTNTLDREAVSEPLNPLGIDGIEFIEFATSKPQALGGVLETMGFRPIARHRSREVELYRQGTMNIIVNSQPADVPRTVQPVERPSSARSRSACATPMPPSAARSISAPGRFRCAPARWSSTFPRSTASARASSISSTATTSSRSTTSTFAPSPPSTRIRRRSAGMHFFGIVQYIGADRTADWVEFYSQIFGFTPLPDACASASCPMGCCCRARAASFFLQLIEPEDTARFAYSEEHLQRIGLGTPDVMAAVGALEKRGVEFLHRKRCTPASAARSPSPVSAA